MARRLEVWLLARHVGTLTQVDGRLEFRYAAEWLTGSAPIALSRSLPLQAEAFDDRASRPFFAGLLPEADKRRLVAQALQVSHQNDFALLDGIGGECAGAVTLLEAGKLPSMPSDTGDVRWLSDDEVLRLLDEMPRRPMLAGEQGLRLSLAGAQDKLPVLVDGERIGLPLNGAPSSHILKPAIPLLDDSVFNEGFCMALGAASKLGVAPTRIRQIADRVFLLVARYDRQHAGHGLPQRLHQEDFCQALGVAPETKYQNEGGPGFAQCFALVRQATRPNAPQVLRLLDAAIFNALIGNHDAHAKNFSLLYTDRGPILAPFYDLIATAVYPKLTDKMAMKLGGKYKFNELHPRHWARFAEEAGLSVAPARQRVLQLARQLPGTARQLQTASDSPFRGHPVVERIVALIEQRATLTIRRLSESGADVASD
jgi:serine/threonine-protein kinase HipA